MRKTLAAIAVLVGVLTGQPAAATPPDRPNILLINADDQRADTLDVMPKVGRWFAEGRRFTRSFVNIPSCCPSRATLLSGDYAHNHGVRHQSDAMNLNVEETLPAYLRRAGYSTAMAGKYLNSWPLEQAPPHFEKYAAIHGGYRPFNVYDSELSADRKHRVDDYSTTWLGRRLESFLEGFTKDRPWFGYFAPIAPHRPWTPEPKYANASVRECVEPDEPDRSDKPGYIQRGKYDIAQFRGVCENSLRTLMSVDDAVDSLLRKVQAIGALDNTLVIYTSDNGYLWGEHGRMSKFVPYLPSLHVPLLLRWPAKVAGGDDDRLVSTVDLLPTLLEAAAVDVPGKAKGFNLLKTGTHGTVFAEYWRDDHNGSIPDWAASFDGRLHYIETYGDSGEVSFVELYDTQADPGEDVNIAARQNVSQLREQLARWRRS